MELTKKYLNKDQKNKYVLNGFTYNIERICMKLKKEKIIIIIEERN